MSITEFYTDKTSPLTYGGEANLSGITYESTVDGDGVRVALFFSGCRHNCVGCHNPQTHNFNTGIPFTEDIQDNIIRYVREHPYVKGITLTGGDPMFSALRIIPFVVKFRRTFPHLDVWVYSGFTYEELWKDYRTSALLMLCDVLVDGPFLQRLKDSSLAFRGSSNQRIIDVQKSVVRGSVVLWQPRSSSEEDCFAYLEG